MEKSIQEPIQCCTNTRFQAPQGSKIYLLSIFLRLFCLIKAGILLSHLLPGFSYRDPERSWNYPSLSLSQPSREQTHTQESYSTLVTSDPMEGEALAFFLQLLSKSFLSCKSTLSKPGNICDNRRYKKRDQRFFSSAKSYKFVVKDQVYQESNNSSNIPRAFTFVPTNLSTLFDTLSAQNHLY